MKKPIKKKAAAKRLTRPGSLIELKGAHTLGSAAKLREKILQNLLGDGPLTIDAGSAEAIDISTLQVLVAAQKTASSRGQDLTVVVPKSTAVATLAQAAGFYGADGRAMIPEAERWTGTLEQAK